MDAGRRRHVSPAEPGERDANVEHTTWNLRVRMRLYYVFHVPHIVSSVVEFELSIV
jgi:hypothetical protein